MGEDYSPVPPGSGGPGMAPCMKIVHSLKKCALLLCVNVKIALRMCILLSQRIDILRASFKDTRKQPDSTACF